MNDTEIQHSITEQINQQLQDFPIENSCVLETVLSNTPMVDILNPSGLSENEMPAVVAECMLTPYGGKTSRQTRSVCRLYIIVDCRNDVSRLYYEGTNGDISSQIGIVKQRVQEELNKNPALTPEQQKQIARNYQNEV